MPEEKTIPVKGTSIDPGNKMTPDDPEAPGSIPDDISDLVSGAAVGKKVQEVSEENVRMGEHAAEIVDALLSNPRKDDKTSRVNTETGPIEVHSAETGNPKTDAETTALFSKDGLVAVRIESDGAVYEFYNPDSDNPTVLVDGSAPRDPAGVDDKLSKIGARI